MMLLGEIPVYKLREVSSMLCHSQVEVYFWFPLDYFWKLLKGSYKKKKLLKRHESNESHQKGNAFFSDVFFFQVQIPLPEPWVMG